MLKSQWPNIMLLTQILIWVEQSPPFVATPSGTCGPQDVETGEELAEGMFLRDWPGVG